MGDVSVGYVSELQHRAIMTVTVLYWSGTILLRSCAES